MTFAALAAKKFLRGGSSLALSGFFVLPHAVGANERSKFVDAFAFAAGGFQVKSFIFHMYCQPKRINCKRT